MNRSLRHRLLLSTVAGAGLVFIVTGFCIYWFAARSLRQEFDESLIAKARALSTLVEDESGRIEFESDLRIMPEFRPGADAEYLELRTAGGRETVYRSPSLADQRLTWPGSLGASAHLADVVLPDGRAGRFVALRFHPRVESQPAFAGSDKNRLVAEVMLAKGTQRLQGQLARLSLLLLIAIACALLGLFAILSRLVKRSLRPLESLAVQIEKINADDLSKSFAVPGSVMELNSVTTTLNHLLARLKAAFDREKGLTADVAHELRTPLSGLRATVDLALRRERTPAEYQQMLIRTRGVVEQMQSLVESLLALARADAGVTELKSERVIWRELVDDCWSPLHPRALQKNLSVDLDIGEGTEAWNSKAVSAQVLSNLLDNAVTYADIGGQMSVRVRQGNDAVLLTVTNSGSSLDPALAPHVFDRFWRGDAARSQNGSHHGLGLSLVKRLVTSMGGSVVARVEGGCFQVELNLPARRQSSDPEPPARQTAATERLINAEIPPDEARP